MTEQAQQVTLSDNVKRQIDEWLKKFPADQKRSASLYALRVAQEEHGWLPQSLMDDIADYLGLAKIAIYEVATFYSMYDLKPRGCHKIGVCTNISCLLRGSDKVATHIKDKLGVGFGESTADGKFMLQEVECLAACAGAPAMIVDDKHYHENLTPEKIDSILDNLE